MIFFLITVIREDDYIGLDLLLPMPIPLTFNLIVDHINDYFDHLSIQISHDGSDWVNYYYCCYFIITNNINISFFSSIVNR